MAAYSSSGASSAAARDLRGKLADALGLVDLKQVTPYLNYIENRRPRRATPDAYLELFLNVVLHFRHPVSSAPGKQGRPNAQQANGAPQNPAPGSIQALIDTLDTSTNELLFDGYKSKTVERSQAIKDMVMYILGVWAMMLTSFVRLPNGYRQVEAAYNIQLEREKAAGRPTLKEALDGSPATLTRRSGLLPSENGGNLSSFRNDNLLAVAQVLLTAIASQTACIIPQTIGQQPCSSLLSTYLSSASSAALHITVPDSLESLSIDRTRLNAYTLTTLCDLSIHWTLNMSRHLLITEHLGRRVVEIFAMPCLFKCSEQWLEPVGITTELKLEIQFSYGTLFNAWNREPWHARIGSVVSLRRWCWCLSCSAYQQRERGIKRLKRTFPAANAQNASFHIADTDAPKSEFDPFLPALMRDSQPTNWSYDAYPYLWPRIVALQEQLTQARPWNFWVLFRDRRDTLQFWTFFFATFVVILTILQTGLSAAQVASGFMPHK